MNIRLKYITRTSAAYHSYKTGATPLVGPSSVQGTWPLHRRDDTMCAESSRLGDLPENYLNRERCHISYFSSLQWLPSLLHLHLLRFNSTGSKLRGAACNGLHHCALLCGWCFCRAKRSLPNISAAAFVSLRACQAPEGSIGVVAVPVKLTFFNFRLIIMPLPQSHFEPQSLIIK